MSRRIPLIGYLGAYMPQDTTLQTKSPEQAFDEFYREYRLSQSSNTETSIHRRGKTMPIIQDIEKLKQVSESVIPVEWEDTKKIVKELIDTANQFPTCVGLAAIQIGYAKRIFIVRNPVKDTWLVFINPTIIRAHGGVKADYEGCMSFPGANELIRRFKEVQVTALDENDTKFEGNFKGFVARVIQHEYDHLNGVNIIDTKRKKVK